MLNEMNPDKRLEVFTSRYRSIYWYFNIVVVNGVFDLLHCGHVEYLKKASSYGKVFVLLNSDESVKKIKGPTRPIIPVDQRKYILKSLRFIEYIHVFDEETPINAIKIIKPDYLIKGSDWEPDKIVGKDFVENYGGKVIRIKLVEGISTTKIIERIKDKE